MSEVATPEVVTEAPVAVAAPEAVEVVETEEKKPFVASGTSLELLSRVGGLSTNSLRPDMPVEERREAIRQNLKSVQRFEDTLTIVNGELLYEVSANEYWKYWTTTDEGTGETRPYRSFDEYSETELNIAKRKAQYLKSIYEKLVLQLQIPIDELQTIQWSKVKDMLPHLNKDNYKEMLSRIEGMSARDVTEMAKAMKPAKAAGTGTVSDKEPDTFKKFSVNLTAEQLETVNSALKLAESMSGSDKPGQCLFLICSDYIAGSMGTGAEGASAKLSHNIAMIERAYGVKLDIVSYDDRYKSLAEAAAAELTPVAGATEDTGVVEA